LKSALEQKRDQHHDNAQAAYNQKQNDATDRQKTVLMFDLQQCLPTPFLQSSIAFYLRQLWTFNLTIRNNSKGNFNHIILLFVDVYLFLFFVFRNNILLYVG